MSCMSLWPVRSYSAGTECTKKHRWRTSARTRWLCEDPEGVIIKEIHSTRTIHYPTSSENNRHLLNAGALIATACWVDFPGKEQDRRRFVPKAPIVSAISVHSNHSYSTERNLVRTKRKEAYLIETWTTGMQKEILQYDYVTSVEELSRVSQSSTFSGQEPK